MGQNSSLATNFASCLTMFFPATKILPEVPLIALPVCYYAALYCQYSKGIEDHRLPF